MLLSFTKAYGIVQLSFLHCLLSIIDKSQKCHFLAFLFSDLDHINLSGDDKLWIGLRRATPSSVFMEWVPDDGKVRKLVSTQNLTLLSLVSLLVCAQ